MTPENLQPFINEFNATFDNLALLAESSTNVGETFKGNMKQKVDDLKDTLGQELVDIMLAKVKTDLIAKFKTDLGI